MSSTETQTRSSAFDELYAKTLSFRPPLLHPPKPHTPSLADPISSLRVHPALEAALHILNYDLPSAHFLGDYDNARAWYKDVSDTEVMEKVWGKGEGVKGGKAEKFISEVQDLDQRLRKGEKGEGVEKEQTRLENESKRELKGIVDYCLNTMGRGVWQDARGAYVESSEKIKKMGQDQTTGPGGMRKF
ncbi:uncharacterized protein LAJ45_02840 [Morchella importuna]|uniref:uncharacterized protein n=1 Tax=Morchella importuna TaxID=1174673 RepID=UPI001E8E6408|nr:uncharacterized protein LAJ45_02840 [Morchella importuna]KAH8153253.1 hypothetical protein LAJ45_02840 [Morchella importuna]